MSAVEGPVGLLMLGAPDGRGLVAVSRPDGPRDGVDPVSELAVLAAAGDWRHAALSIPVRVRDLADGDIVSRHTLVTFLECRADGDVEMSVVGLMDDTPPSAALDGAGWALDVEQSPVAPLLFDSVVRVDEAPPLQQVAAILRTWGHDVSTDIELADVDHRRLPGDRHRVHRLARELGRRNRPEAPGVDANRPGVPANLPVGFVPACPL